MIKIIIITNEDLFILLLLLMLLLSPPKININVDNQRLISKISIVKLSCCCFLSLVVVSKILVICYDDNSYNKLIMILLDVLENRCCSCRSYIYKYVLQNDHINNYDDDDN